MEKFAIRTNAGLLWRLKHDVYDERFIRILEDLAILIRNSEMVCREANRAGEDDQQFVIDAECDYLEDIIGASFVVLQTKLRRVQTSAINLYMSMSSKPLNKVDRADRKTDKAARKTDQAKKATYLRE